MQAEPPPTESAHEVAEQAPIPESAGPKSEPPSQAPSYVFLAIVTVVSAGLDLASKGWAKATLQGVEGKGATPKHFVVIRDHFDFIYAQNPGGAWSFLRSLPEYMRRPFFLFISAAAIVFIVSIYRRVRPDQTAMKWGLPLALGGAVGNLVDRIRYGYVIDFIDVYFKRGANEHHWPTFNVADIAICIGVALMAIDMLFGARRATGGSPAAIAPTPRPARRSASSRMRLCR